MVEHRRLLEQTKPLSVRPQHIGWAPRGQLVLEGELRRRSDAFHPLRRSLKRRSLRLLLLPGLRLIRPLLLARLLLQLELLHRDPRPKVESLSGSHGGRGNHHSDARLEEHRRNHDGLVDDTATKGVGLKRVGRSYWRLLRSVMVVRMMHGRPAVESALGQVETRQRIGHCRRGSTSHRDADNGVGVMMVRRSAAHRERRQQIGWNDGRARQRGPVVC